MITVSAFRWVPPFARGQVRDLRVRWALEEAGLPYRTRLLSQGDQDKTDYRDLQPFGQVPVFEENGFVLFESGAIVLHIGERSDTLLPKDPLRRARAQQWLIAALNSIEPFVQNVALIDLFYANEEWAKLRRPSAVAFLDKRLAALAKSLGSKPYLDGERFTAGDLMMSTVLRILPESTARHAPLDAYVARCTARPAFKRALEAQIGDFANAAEEISMSYIEGLVLAVPAAKKDAYRDFASRASELLKEYGATRVVECWGDDVPDGKLTDFKRAVKAEPDEIVVFSWIEYPDKTVRDSAVSKMMSDSRMQDLGAMPFDGKRMIMGGFATLLDAR